MTVRRGLVALGDSITRGRGGAPALGVHPQSWALWLAEALELPITILAQDGAEAHDVVNHQLPRLSPPYDLGTLYIGANDARSDSFDADAFKHHSGTTLQALSEAADRVLVLTIPTDLGRPRAGAAVVTANAILRAHAERTGATVCPLDDFAGARVVLPDAVHPTSAGMVEIAERALAALGAPAAIDSDERRDPIAKARYAAWYAKQELRDRRRRWVER